MKRHNDLDLSILDRTRTSMRQMGRSAREQSEQHEDVAGIGAACGIVGTGAMARPTCDNTSLDYLDRYFATTAASARNVAGGANGTVTFDPLDQVFCPVAVAVVAFDANDPSLPRTGFILNVDIRGCKMLDFQNATETAAGATAWIPTQAWDPFARSGCACPVNWGCFTNVGTRSAILTITVANPHTTATSYIFTVYGVGYTCCPGFVNGGFDAMQLPHRPEIPTAPVPTSAPAPIGRAPLFAR